MLHGDTKRLPLLVGQTTTDRREYLFVAIDDYSRELFAVILPDKMQTSSARFMEQVVDECAYTIEVCYTDNGHTSHWGIKLSLKFIAAGMAIETIHVSRARTA